MEDDFLRDLNRQPRPEFTKALYGRLSRKPTRPAPVRKLWLNWKLAPVGAAALVIMALLVSPSARALAQDFLNLFRVKRFAAVTVDPAIVSQLENSKLDIQALIGSSVETLKQPGKPQAVDSAEQAGQLAGITVRLPASMPESYGQPEIMVQGEASLRFTADTTRLQAIVDALGTADVTIPPQLNGATVTVDKPPVVAVIYRNGRNRVMFLQSRNPSIGLPEGVQLSDLGEIALRITGMPADEARLFAQAVDWTSTLLVPIPANAATFREVQVRGAPGLLITSRGGTPELTFGDRSVPQGSVVLWSEGDTIYAATGSPDVTTLVEMANSLN